MFSRVATEAVISTAIFFVSLSSHFEIAMLRLLWHL